MSIQVLSYWRPLHPAIRYYCNLCGSETGKDEYQTAQARRMEAFEKEGHYVFCKECAPNVNAIVQEIAAEEQALTMQAAQDVQEKLAAKARELLDKLTGAAVEASPPSASSVSPPDSAPRRRPSTRIPSPR